MPEKKSVWPFLLSTMLALNSCSPAFQPESGSAPKVASQEAYSEIAGYPIRIQGELVTRTGGVRWMNFTDFTFNPRPMEELFRYFQDWASENPTLQIPWQRQMRTATLTRRPARNVNLYLVPQDAPVPGWWTANLDAGTRVHYFPQGYEEAITIVRVNQPVISFPSDEINNVMNKDAEGSLATEACQSSVRLEMPGVDYRELQEVFCNSVGLASFMNKNRYPYELYAKLTSLVTMYDSAGRPLPYLPFSPSRYAAFSKERIISGN